MNNIHSPNFFTELSRSSSFGPTPNRPTSPVKPPSQALILTQRHRSTAEVRSVPMSESSSTQKTSVPASHGTGVSENPPSSGHNSWMMMRSPTRPSSITRNDASASTQTPL
ncbi:hypothetical protein FRB96_009685, partial [Tulasnella sp. 330]